jgi:hypothetical protein
MTRLDNGYIAHMRVVNAAQVGCRRTMLMGFLPQRPARYVPLADGELGLVDGKRCAKANLQDPETRAQWHAMLASISIERGYKAGWAAVNYKEKFGDWPPYGATPTPINPTPEVRSWVRSRLIAYDKRRGAA